jgi:hypothetical protein
MQTNIEVGAQVLRAWGERLSALPYGPALSLIDLRAWSTSHDEAGNDD